MSKIEWTEKTWNPIAGCSRVSEGCRHCYAEIMAKRLVAMGQEKYQDTVDERGFWTGKINFDEKALLEPLNRKKPTVYFVNSMSDLFHENVPDEWIARIFDVMYRANWHTFQVLTKRPQRMYDVVSSHYEEFGDLGGPPPKHVWLGVSVENQQAADERIPLLLSTPAAVRFLSCEPLLGPVKFFDHWITRATSSIDYHQRTGGNPFVGERVDWVIVGGESGPGARPMHPDWVRSLRDQCQTSGVPFFFKQWGEYTPLSPLYLSDCKTELEMERCDSELHDWSDHRFVALDRDGFCWKQEKAQPCLGTYMMWRTGKKSAGRHLDGRTWDEMPEVGHG